MMSNWKHDAADANLRMAQKMLEQQGEINRLKNVFLTLAEHVCGGIDRDGQLCPECLENVKSIKS